MDADDLKARALRLIAQREHTRAELAQKLTPHGEPEAVEATLARMDELGFLSDARFAEGYVRSRAQRLGRRRLEHELAQRGVAPDEAAAALDAELDGDELSRARAVWARKFGVAPTEPKEWARQARFLSARGFASDVIRRVLKEPFDEPA